MLFNSFEFLILFLPCVLLLALRLKGASLLFWICASSFIFYALAGHAWFLIPMLVTTVLDYFVGLSIEKAKSNTTRKVLLFSSLTCNLGLLAFFKYSNLLLEALRNLFTVVGLPTTSQSLPVLSIVLPAGISFYTFQTISYVVDIYRRETEAEKNFFKFVGFVTFFPHLVAGPLTRHHQLIPQLTKISIKGINPLWRSGIYLFSIGLIKKVVIADRIAAVIDPAIAQIEMAGTVLSWLALVGYSMQIYFDFSGYTDMAIGLGRLFGIELPVNFNSPYKAKDPSDFWRRWHISLSQWLRDYLYRPLGGNKTGNHSFNLLATMVLGGLWHGANFTFLYWGFYHGLLLILFKKLEPTWKTWPIYCQRALTVLLVWIGWVFFRSPNIGTAFTWLKHLFGFTPRGIPFEPSLSMTLIPIAFLICLNLNNSSELRWESFSTRASVSLALLTGLALLMVNYSSQFLYFQF